MKNIRKHKIVNREILPMIGGLMTEIKGLKELVRSVIFEKEREEKRLEDVVKELKIICPFCNAAYTAEMVDELEIAGGCDTCGDDGDIYGTIDIICSNCKKIVYSKEIER